MQSRLSIKAVPVLVRERRILLIREKRYDGGQFPGYWDVPGGTLKEGETIFECLARELQEEVGLTLPAHKDVIFDMYAFEACGTMRMYIPVPFWHKPAVRLGSDHDCAEWFCRVDNAQQLMPNLLQICQRVLNGIKVH